MTRFLIGCAPREGDQPTARFTVEEILASSEAITSFTAKEVGQALP